MTLRFAAATAACLAILATGCLVESTPRTWDEFKAEYTRPGPSGPMYVIEWDRVVTEDELADYYHLYLDGSWDQPSLHATVGRVGDADDVWTDAEKRDLTYCVSDSFGDDKARAVREMAAAASDWEAVADVDFIYKAEFDGDCAAGADSVRVPVIPHTGGGAYTYLPSGLRTSVRALTMNFNDFDTNEAYAELAPNITTTGVFRHELGHVLGLVHEHVRSETAFCNDASSYRAVTTYDPGSVMHYPWCDGVLTSDLSITSLDAEGIAELYGKP